MKKYYKTDDCPRAAYLDIKGFECIGAVPGTRYGRKNFVIAYDEDREEELLKAESDYLNKNDQVSAIEFWRTQKRIKRYINDIPEN